MRRTLTMITGAALLAGAATFSVAQQPNNAGDAADVLGKADAMERAPRDPRSPRGPHLRGARHEGGERELNLEGVGADVAMASIESMGEARKAALETIRTRTKEAVEAVRALDANEAPDEALRVAATQARDAIVQATLRADTAISTEALEAVRALTAAGADERVIFAVLRAREGNQAAVLRGSMRAGHGLRMVVGVATGEIDQERLRERGRRGEDGRERGRRDTTQAR
ncbi:MAG: hypothetical protein ACTS27_07025 [Phycisphaerales bacterium]